MELLGSDLQARIEDKSPGGETGELKRSWSSRVFGGGRHLVVKSSADHANFPEFGTGLWGPSHDFIRPRPDNRAGGYLVFWSRGRKYVVKQVKGQKPQLYVFSVLKSMFPTSRIKRKNR